jgi:hypothetical protein
VADPAERQILAVLLEAIEDPTRAGSLPGGDPRALALARRHRLSPLLAAVCRDGLPGLLGEACRRDRGITTARNLMLVEAAEELLLAMAARRIDGVVLKGLAYERQLYDDAGPGCRPTADVDVMVRERDRRAAFRVLSDLGYEPRAAAPGFDGRRYHEVAWTRGHVSVDLHMALAPLVRCAVDYGAVWSGVRPINVGRAPALALAPAHAAVFHALHMAIDHFDVPALYLVDLARLLPGPEETAAAGEVARAWRCRRPLGTSLALAAAFLPGWAARQPAAPVAAAGRGRGRSDAARAARVVAAFGGAASVARAEQLRRKLAHFDAARDAVRYAAVQAARNARELWERHVRRRSPRARLRIDDV